MSQNYNEIIVNCKHCNKESTLEPGDYYRIVIEEYDSEPNLESYRKPISEIMKKYNVTGWWMRQGDDNCEPNFELYLGTKDADIFNIKNDLKKIPSIDKVELKFFNK